MNINFRIFGQGYPVVFFNGWGVFKQVWLPLIKSLSLYNQLILVDLPGFGFTATMSWEEFKKQLLEQLPNVFAVVGWSLGGLYAQRLAIEESHHVSSLMCITSSPCFIADKSWPAVPENIFTQFYNNISIDREKTLKDFISLQLNKAPLSLPLGEIPSLQGLQEGLKILELWDLREQLHNISMPASFLFGRLDPIAPVKIMEVMQVLYPNYDYVLFRHSAHMPFLSHMDLFIDEFRRFIQ